MQEALTERPSHVPADRVVDFDLYAPAGVRDDLHAAWKKLHAPGVPDIIWTPRNGGHWLVTRNRLINDVMSDYEHFSSRSIIIPKETTEIRLLPIMVDPPVHRPFRVLLNSSLSPRMVLQAHDKIRAVADDLISGLSRLGRCNFVTDYAELLPIHIFLSMADLPVSDAPLLRKFADAINRPDPDGDWGDDPSPFAWAVRNFFDYLTPIVDARTGKDGDDILSRIVNGTIDGRPLSKQEALQLTTQTLVGGLDTVVNFLGFVMVHLARHPDDRCELVVNPDLIPTAVEEMLRRYPIITIGREVVDDIEYEGVLLKRGDMVATPTTLSGIDESINVDPLTVDFHRASGEHSTFGNGAHRCPGAHLARAEIRITIEQWLAHIPDFELAPDKTVTYAGGLTATVEDVHLIWEPRG